MLEGWLQVRDAWLPGDSHVFHGACTLFDTGAIYVCRRDDDAYISTRCMVPISVRAWMSAAMNFRNGKLGFVSIVLGCGKGSRISQQREQKPFCNISCV
jgi:hypothetical protein